MKKNTPYNPPTEDEIRAEIRREAENILKDENQFYGSEYYIRMLEVLVLIGWMVAVFFSLIVFR